MGAEWIIASRLQRRSPSTTSIREDHPVGDAMPSANRTPTAVQGRIHDHDRRRDEQPRELQAFPRRKQCREREVTGEDHRYIPRHGAEVLKVKALLEGHQYL